jgi:hypothetical protein
MDALAAASRARSDHEVADHGYRHVIIPNESSRIWTQRISRNKERR